MDSGTGAKVFINKLSFRQSFRFWHTNSSRNHVRLCWVLGHSNIEGNVVAHNLIINGSKDTSLIFKGYILSEIRNEGERVK